MFDTSLTRSVRLSVIVACLLIAGFTAVPHAAQAPAAAQPTAAGQPAAAAPAAQHAPAAKPISSSRTWEASSSRGSTAARC